VTKKEFERQRRVVSQSLSAHTSLAETMRRRRRLLLAAILVLSVAATALAFAEETNHVDFVFSASLPVWAGVLSAIVFVLALLDMLFGWDKLAAAHEDAAGRLTTLSALYRGLRQEGEAVDTGSIDLEAEYWAVMNGIAPIPNRHFVRLKAKHLRKVARSQALDRDRNASLLALKAKLFVCDTWSLLKRPCSIQEKQGPETFLTDETSSDSENDSGRS
jgi:hypothetical protein